MNRTNIEWVKNPDGTQGYTWNPITGCLNHIGGMCKGGNFPCYAYKLANGRLKSKYLASENYPEQSRYVRAPFYPRFWPERLEDTSRKLKSHKPKGIFVCDMGELFGNWIPEDWIKDVLFVIKQAPQHRFYLLTKQPQNLVKWSPFPSNCCVGVTVTHDDMMIPTSRAFDSIVVKYPGPRFISFEPFLGRLSKWSLKQIRDYICQWVIIGAQTKPTVYPKIEHVQEIVEASDRAGIPVFLKNNLAPALEVRPPFIEKTKDRIRYPRQEMPK